MRIKVFAHEHITDLTMLQIGYAYFHTEYLEKTGQCKTFDDTTGL